MCTAVYRTNYDVTPSNDQTPWHVSRAHNQGNHYRWRIVARGMLLQRPVHKRARHKKNDHKSAPTVTREMRYERGRPCIIMPRSQRASFRDHVLKLKGCMTITIKGKAHFVGKFQPQRILSFEWPSMMTPNAEIRESPARNWVGGWLSWVCVRG